ncbi:MAG: malectin domain-containing carbohydrate-binding protein, partial [Bacteroidales bacterium]
MGLKLYHVVALQSLLLIANFLQAQAPAGFTWQKAENVNFGEAANHFTIEAASAGMGGEVELRLDATDGPVIGRAFFHHTGSPEYFLPYECELTQSISGTHNVYMRFQDYTEPVKGGVLKTGDFQFTNVEEEPVVGGDSLHIYPPVPGLNPSPYYEIYIQKVSKLNSLNLAEVTNWETPFAWFTQCPDNAADGDNKGYYSTFIGGWSNTYTNFELDMNTPIVVKIVRKDDTGDDAPAGPINTAMVRPANRVDSWEIIDGDVYITMSQPALVAVDIDGQMETRVSPRATPKGWNAAAFPYRNKKDGAHSVTIFANPFINDKPGPGDPGVLVVKAGEKIPTTQELQNKQWDILYFEPGVHKASVDVDSDGNLIERKWQADDPITLQDNKSYYIPGDAIVYANFTDINRSNNQSVNIRIYGHGTVSGSKINHNKVEGEAYSNEGWWNRALYLRDAKNCHYEGVTVVDPAFHTLCIGSTVKQTYEPNTIKWAKIIAWRTNSDGTSVGGNVEMEDCFIRCQDDGHYIGGTTLMRRVVFWHDVNGQTFRSDFSNRRYSQDNAPNIPELIVYEDIDLIYARGVFTTSDNGYGIIGVGDNRGSDNETLNGGVENTGQMIYFRNIRITDPLPTRNLFSFDGESKNGDYAGFRFENIDYQGKQVFGWRNKLKGGPNSILRNFVFDNVSVEGQKINADYVNNPVKTITGKISNFTFRSTDSIPSTTYTLTRTSTNGTINIDLPEETAEVTLTAIPIDGYKFIGWSGDLSGTDSVATITMDRNKTITANFSQIYYSISAIDGNGTFSFTPSLDSFLLGTVVTVKAVGNLGYGFESWSGDLSGTKNPTTLMMDGDKMISAAFVEVPTYALTVNPEFGSVILDPSGVEYNEGTHVVLTPEPNPGYYFEQWMGDLEGSENPATITMDADKTVTARFVYAGFGKTSSAINFGGPDYEASDGTVFTGNQDGNKYSTTSDISGTEDDQLYQTERYGNSFSYNIPVENATYTITFMFAEIYQTSAGTRVFNVSLEGEEVISNLDIFAKVGKDAAFDETFEVTIIDGEINIGFSASVNNAKISAIKIMSDVFEGDTYTLSTNVQANGVIEADPAEGPYPAGSNVVLTATPDPGYKFDGWSGDLAGIENPVILYMNSDKNISATFVETNWYTVTTSATNGMISMNPDEGIYGYTEGTEVTFTAIPDERYMFTGWSGDLSGTGNPATIVMDADKTVTANFGELTYYTLSIEAANGSITLDPPGGEYSEGTVVTLTADPASGFIFKEWSSDITGSENPVTIIINSAKTVSAEFENPNALLLTINSENGTVQVTPAQNSYFRGATVILVATPDEGYKFIGWEGDLSGSNNPLGFVMD